MSSTNSIEGIVRMAHANALSKSIKTQERGYRLPFLTHGHFSESMALVSLPYRSCSLSQGYLDASVCGGSDTIIAPFTTNFGMKP